MNNKFTLRSFFTVSLLFFFTLSAMPLLALDAEYEKNGEVYMLIGGESSNVRGVYNMNNKVANLGPQLLYDPGAAYGINVDRQRIIYTYNLSAASDTTWTLASGKIQINTSRIGRGYGTHHYKADTKTRCTCRTSSPTWTFSGGVLTMPNAFWYHMPNDRCRKVTRKKWDQIYDLLKWPVAQKTIGASPDPHIAGIAVKSRAKDSYWTINHCHDGCGGVNSTGDGPITEPVSDIAINGRGDAYQYKRTVGKNDGKIIKNGAVYNGPYIGNLNDPTTKYIAISTGTPDDYVYVLGNNTIKQWLQAANFGSNNANFNLNQLDITDIVVSDQWWATGGIVYAFDKPSNNVYKFVRNEASGNYDAEAISIDDTTGTVDSIATDGFGSLYYVMNYMTPIKKELFTPASYKTLVWEVKDTVNGNAVGEAVYKQKVSKSVFCLPITGGAPTVVGEKVIGYNTYRRPIEVKPYDGTQILTDATLWDSPNYYLVGNAIADSSPVEISAINFGTPPEVLGFQDPNNPSSVIGHVDIDGPYKISTDPDTPFTPYTTSEWSKYEENQFYMFLAENFPITNTNGINIRATGLADESASHVSDAVGSATGALSKNNLAWTGGLPSTIDGSSVKYKWQVFQTKDRFGNDKDTDGNALKRQVWPPPQDNTVPLWSDAPVLGIFFDGGDYEITLDIKYNWWDYDQLPYGSSVANRTSVYKTNYKSIAKDGTTTAKMKIHVEPKVVDELTNSGQIKLFVNNGTGWQIKNPAKTTNAGNNYINYYVVNQGTTCRWVLDERPGISPANQRTGIMTAALPPAPPAGTSYDNLAWDAQGHVTKWKFELPDPRTADPDDTLITAPNVLASADAIYEMKTPLTAAQRSSMGWSNDLDQDPRILSVPSDPYYYTVYANSYRSYSYDMFAKINLKDANGNVIMNKMVKLPYKRMIQLEAMAKVLVLDTEAPKLFSLNSPAFIETALKAYAGSALTETALANPSDIEVMFVDNNPFGNVDIANTELASLSKHSLNNKFSGFAYQTCDELDYYGYTSTGSIYKTQIRPLVNPNIITVPNLTEKADVDAPAALAAPSLPRKLNGTTLSSAADSSQRTQFYKYSWFADTAKQLTPTDITTVPLEGAAKPTQAQGGSLFKSYMKVTVPLSSLTDFSTHGAVLPVYYARNRDNYQRLLMSMRLADSSGNDSGLARVGDIDVIDNKRPNAFVTISDSNTPNPLYLPRNMTLTPDERNITNTWHYLDESDWAPGHTFTNVLPVPALPLPLASVTSGEVLFGTMASSVGGDDRNLEEDKRYFFKLNCFDNVPTRLYTHANSAALSPAQRSETKPNYKNQIAVQCISDASEFNWSSPTGLDHTVFNKGTYILFRKPSQLNFTLTLRDHVECTDSGDDLYPTYPAGISYNPFDDPDTPGYAKKRDITYSIKVIDTSINVHTLESN
jgi:hypothetical protein